MEYLLTSIFIILFALVIWKWKWFHDDRVKKYIFISLFIIKAAAGIFAGELYKYKYGGGDQFAYFSDSKILTNSFYTSPSDFLSMLVGSMEDKIFAEQHGLMEGWTNADVVYNDNRTIIRLHAIIGLISLGYFNVHVVFFAFLSMLGLMGIYKSARLLTDQNPMLLIGAVFLAPGVLFWCSMASKESLLIFTMGMFLYHCIRLLTISKSTWNMAGMFLAGFLFIHIKAYFLILITPCLFAFTWVHVSNQKFSLIKYSFIYLICTVLFFSVKYILDGVDPVDILVMKRLNFEAFAQASPADFGSYIELPEFSSDWGDIITVSPIAAFSVLTRPYIWESGNILMILAALENLLLLGVAAIGFRFLKWDRMAKNKNLLLFCLSLVITTFILVGLTSPVLGAIVRYKAPVLPFLLLIPLLITNSYRTKKF